MNEISQLSMYLVIIDNAGNDGDNHLFTHLTQLFLSVKIDQKVALISSTQI